MAEPACPVGPDLHYVHWAGLGAWWPSWEDASAAWSCSTAACTRLRYILLLAAVVSIRYAWRLARARSLRRRATADGGKSLCGGSPRGSYTGGPYAGDPPATELQGLIRSPPRSEAAKEAEAEAMARALHAALPPGPQYLSREELVAAVKPSDAQLALCALYSNRRAPSVCLRSLYMSILGRAMPAQRRGAAVQVALSFLQCWVSCNIPANLDGGAVSLLGRERGQKSCGVPGACTA